MGVALTASAQLQDFDMQQIRVSDPYYQQLFTVDIDYILRLDPADCLPDSKPSSEPRSSLCAPQQKQCDRSGTCAATGFRAVALSPSTQE